MEKSAELLQVSKKIVIKIGSSVLSDETGSVNRGTLKNIANQVCQLKNSGKQVIIVSSGAGICGVGAINRWDRRDDINYKQALCAIGQVELMQAYKEYLLEHGLIVAQMLLTAEDFRDCNRNLNIRNTLFTLVDEGVVPIINENDSVSVDEIKIGDNDMLAAHTAVLWNADLLILLSDIDGLYDKSPKEHDNARLIREVYDLTTLVGSIEVGEKSSFGTGGIMTKIAAAKETGKHNIPTIIMNGRVENIILNVASDCETNATTFLGFDIMSGR
ncbi:MAG: glutamate 5-kinase [Clostridiales Family XIII bacterium]|jgi:glutamate 5-kinase|nr:glutamate 5-kinase [Clostridiales Family XIII bacterium]